MISALLEDPTGGVWVGGVFTSLAGTWTPLASPRIARLSTTCGATAATSSAGCAGSGGANVLTPLTLPWIGSTFRARATGMPPTAFVLAVYGLAPLSIPFASIHPAGLAGCNVLATNELVDVYFPSAGVVDTQLALADTPAIVGMTFYHYVVPIEVDAMLAITAITSSNSLACVVGAF